MMEFRKRQLLQISMTVGLFASSEVVWATKATRPEVASASQQCAEGRKKIAPLMEVALKTIDGKKTSLKEYQGRVMLVVNTASRCGYTSQYGELQSVFEKYKERGFVVLGFPANDFGSQEPGSNQEIKEFCTVNFKVQFPMFEKASVVGKEQQPLYRILTSTSNASSGLKPGPIKWNFEKFLIDRDGQVLKRFPSSVAPDEPELTQAIESALLAKEGAACS